MVFGERSPIAEAVVEVVLFGKKTEGEEEREDGQSERMEGKWEAESLDGWLQLRRSVS